MDDVVVLVPKRPAVHRTWVKCTCPKCRREWEAFMLDPTTDILCTECFFDSMKRTA